jgi:ribosomal protein S18 acetylase RimI-like enzyme
MSTPEALRRRGDLLLTKSGTGELLGMVICVRPASPARQVAQPDEAELHLLAVRPVSRGCGIATALVAACEQHASALGFRKMVLSTQPSMRAAHRVYRRLGYRRNATRDWSTVPPAKRYVVYEKSLV